MARLTRPMPLLVVLIVGWLLTTSSPASAVHPLSENTCFGLPATILGTDHHDFLEGTRGDDVIVGLEGNDLIRGMGGNDRLCGGRGKDDLSVADEFRHDVGRMSGGPGIDALVGGPGNDTMLGGPDNDGLYGQEGMGGTDHDRLNGGGGLGDYCYWDDGDLAANCEINP